MHDCRQFAVLRTSETTLSICSPNKWIHWPSNSINLNGFIGQWVLLDLANSLSLLAPRPDASIYNLTAGKAFNFYHDHYGQTDSIQLSYSLFIKPRQISWCWFSIFNTEVLRKWRTLLQLQSQFPCRQAQSVIVYHAKALQITSTKSNRQSYPPQRQ